MKGFCTIVTAGGLVFIGGSKDEKFHAFDKSTGKLLWQFKLDAGGYAGVGRQWLRWLVASLGLPGKEDGRGRGQEGEAA